MNWFGQESLREMEDDTQTAEVTLFLQFDGGSEFLKVLEGKGLCFCLRSMFERCLITFSKL